MNYIFVDNADDPDYFETLINVSSLDFAYPYYLTSAEVTDNNLGLIAEQDLEISSDKVIDYSIVDALSSSNFNLFVGLDLYESNGDQIGNAQDSMKHTIDPDMVTHIDIGDYSYRRSCHHNLEITKCDNLKIQVTNV